MWDFRLYWSSTTYRAVPNIQGSASWKHSNLQWKMLHFLQSTTSNIPGIPIRTTMILIIRTKICIIVEDISISLSYILGCNGLLWISGRLIGRWIQSSASRVPIVGALETAQRRCKRTILDGSCKRPIRSKELEVDWWKTSLRFILESSGRKWQLCKVWWHKRMALVRHQLWIEFEFHLPTP